MKQISTGSAPEVIGPYSQALTTGKFTFCSGQIGIDPETKALVEGGIKMQTLQIFRNIQAILGAAGLKLNNIIKTTLFLADMDDFSKVNEIYAARFGIHKPARSTVQAARLPMDALIEIECIAISEE